MRRVVVVVSRTTWGFTDGSSSFPYPFKLDTYRERAAERAKQEWIWRGSAGRVFPWIGVLAKGDTQRFCRDGQTKFHQAEKATNKRPPPPKKGLVYWDLLGCIRCPRDTPLISPFLCPYGREDTNRTRYTFIHVLDTHTETHRWKTIHCIYSRIDDGWEGTDNAPFRTSEYIVSVCPITNKVTCYMTGQKFISNTIDMYVSIERQKRTYIYYILLDI